MNQKEKGQSMVEMVFLIGISFLLLSGLVVSAIFSLKAFRYSRNKAIATRVAREQVEGVKGEKQSADFWDTLSENCNSSASDCPDPPDDFGCQYCFADISEGDNKKQAKLKVIVWWDSANPPSNWWDFDPLSPPRKDNVIISTIISNWEK